MGKVRAYRQIAYTHNGGDGQPACRIVFEIRDEVPILASFTLSSTDQIVARAEHLRTFRIEDLREEVFGYIGVFVPNSNVPGGWELHVGPQALRQGRKHVEQATRPRKNTHQRLVEVAKVYTTTEGTEGRRVQAVQKAFPTKRGPLGERQAKRLIGYAKKEGHIDD